MRGVPSYLYPSKPLDRSLRARLQRAVASRTDRLRRRVPPLLSIARELTVAAGDGGVRAVGRMLSAWVRDGIDPRVFAAHLLWTVPRDELGDFVWVRELDRFFAATLDASDRTLMQDKAGCAEEGRRRGFPWVQTLAVVNRREGAALPDVPAIDTPDALVTSLSALARSGDVFLKPSCGKQGRGVFRVGRESGIVDAEGGRMEPAELAEDVFAYRHPAGAFGYVVQPFLESHGEMRELTGVSEISTLRVITAVRNGEARTLRAFLKIPAAGRLTNNFRSGASGSLLAPLDTATGRLGELVGLLRPRSRFVVERTAVHPATGRTIAGREMPDWRNALDLCERAALLHPRTATLGWDIADAPSGWIFLEVNTMWGPGGPQAATSRGLRPDLARAFPDHWC